LIFGYKDWVGTIAYLSLSKLKQMEINNGADYANSVIDGILKIETTLPDDQKLPDTLLSLWFEEIKEYADITWTEYLTGKRDDYMFTEDEITEVYNKAGLRYTQELLNGLVDKGMVDVGIDENGEIVYSTTDKGRQALGESE
jgi:hypothetical protein